VTIDVKDPLRPAHHELDDATRLGDRDRFRERPMRAGAAAHGGRLLNMMETGAAMKDQSK